MSNKTKIVVLRMKEIIYSSIFALLGILFLVLLIIMFVPDKEEDATPPSSTPEVTDAAYIPGVYSTSIRLGNQTVDIELMVDENNINSIEIVNLSEEVETMYPLVEPTFEDLAAQILNGQSLNEITYSDDAKYTSLVLLEAIKTSLDKARAREDTSSTENSES